MNTKKIQISPQSSIITLLLTSILMIGCGSDNNSAELNRAVDLEGQRANGTIIEKVTIVGGNTRLRAAETHQLSATGINSKNKVRDITNELIWSSSDISIATINKNGLVTAVANSSVNQGIITITGTTINDIFGEGEMSVSDSAVKAIDLKTTLSDSDTINTCISANIKGDVTYDDDYFSLNTVKGMNFFVDGNTTATIDKNGILYTSASEIEDTIVTGKIDNITGQLTVTANPKNINNIDILIVKKVTNLITLDVGDRIQVNAQASLMNEIPTYNINNTVSWSQQVSTNNIGITTVDDKKGTIFALKPGFTQLVGSCGGKQAITTVEVKGDADLDTIQINDDSSTYTVEPLKTIELKLTANYTTTPASLNVTEFAVWNINSSRNLIKGNLINKGTKQARYKLTSTSSETGTANILVTYGGITKLATINIEPTN